jgi:hypothetical protein
MKEHAQAINKFLCSNKEFHPQQLISCGSFKTIPNSLRQFPVKNLIISEALLDSTFLNDYKKNIFAYPRDLCLVLTCTNSIAINRGVWQI